MAMENDRHTQKIAAIFRELSGFGIAIEEGRDPVPHYRALEDFSAGDPAAVQEALVTAFFYQGMLKTRAPAEMPADHPSHPATRQARVYDLSRALGHELEGVPAAELDAVNVAVP